MGVEKKVYSFRLEQELMERIARRAKAENRTLSNMVETILLRYCQQEEENAGEHRR